MRYSPCERLNLPLKGKGGEEEGREGGREKEREGGSILSRIV